MQVIDSLAAFIVACEVLLERAGRQAAVVEGSLKQDARVYDTPGLKVVGGEGQALEIEIRYQREDGSTCTNPVVMRAANGDLYRTHGEWRYGIRRVQELLAGEQPNTLIEPERDA